LVLCYSCAAAAAAVGDDDDEQVEYAVDEADQSFYRRPSHTVIK